MVEGWGTCSGWIRESLNCKLTAYLSAPDSLPRHHRESHQRLPRGREYQIVRRWQGLGRRRLQQHLSVPGPVQYSKYYCRLRSLRQSPAHRASSPAQTLQFLVSQFQLQSRSSQSPTHSTRGFGPELLPRRRATAIQSQAKSVPLQSVRCSEASPRATDEWKHEL